MSLFDIFALICMISIFTYGAYTIHKQDKEYGLYKSDK